MTPLPPLPLIDEHLFVDNSFLEGLNTCPRATEYSFLRRRVLSNSAPALNFGGAIHEALAIRYRLEGTIPISNIEEQQVQYLTDHFIKFPNPEEDKHQTPLAQDMIRAYNRRYSVEEWTVGMVNDKPAVELPFVFKLGEFACGDKTLVVMYCGRIDLVVSDGGQIFVLDHKTTSILGEQFFKGLSVSPQMIGYMYGLIRACGIVPAGFIVNALFKPSPRKRVEMQITTKDFERLKVHVDEHRLAEWHLNTVALVKEFLWQYDRGYMPMKRQWCMSKFGPCQYFDVCELPPDNRTVLLQSGMYNDQEWSPLNNFPNMKNETNQNPNTR